MPAITPETFPYRRKWTQEQLNEILDRKDRLVAAMTDAVGPTGQVLYLPIDLLHILALHMSLAGCEVEDRLAYIVSRPVKQDKPEELVFQDAREWVLRQEYEPGPPDIDETASQAKAAAEKIRRQLSPEVTAALAHILADGLNAVAINNATTSEQLASAHQAEEEMRDIAREAGDQ